MKRKLLLILSLVVVLLLVVAGCGGKSSEPPAEQQAQEQEQPQEQPQQQPVAEEQASSEGGEKQEFAFVASSEKPDGCASCHVKVAEDQDYRLSVEVSHIEGHPAVAEEVTVSTCIACHKDGNVGPAFKEKLHEVHLLGEENHFVANYGGACNQCHKMVDSGQMAVKGLEAGGSKFVEIKTASVDLAADGCASCHVQNGENDYRLSAEVKKIEGHPAVAEDAEVDTCIACHKDGKVGPAFKQVLHLKHYAGGDDNHFTNYGSSCRNCHSIADNGAIGVKGL